MRKPIAESRQDPRSRFNQHQFGLWTSSLYGPSERSSDRAITPDDFYGPDFLWAHRNPGLAYEQKKMYDAAIAEFQKVQELSHGEAGEWALGHVYAVAGRRDEALKIIEASKERSKRRYSAEFKLSVIYAGLSDKDQAFEWLDKAFVERDPCMKNLKVDPWFDNLHSDSRLQICYGA